MLVTFSAVEYDDKKKTTVADDDDLDDLFDKNGKVTYIYIELQHLILRFYIDSNNEDMEEDKKK